MTSSLILCGCGLAKHQTTVDGPSGLLVALTCEHCDLPCAERRCSFCRALSRADATNTKD